MGCVGRLDFASVVLAIGEQEQDLGTNPHLAIGVGAICSVLEFLDAERERVANCRAIFVLLRSAQLTQRINDHVVIECEWHDCVSECRKGDDAEQIVLAATQAIAARDEILRDNFERSESFNILAADFEIMRAHRT